MENINIWIIEIIDVVKHQYNASWIANNKPKKEKSHTPSQKEYGVQLIIIKSHIARKSDREINKKAEE